MYHFYKRMLNFPVKKANKEHLFISLPSKHLTEITKGAFQSTNGSYQKNNKTYAGNYEVGNLAQSTR